MGFRHRLQLSVSSRFRSQLVVTAVFVLVAVLACALGCHKPAAPINADPATTPWLDPKAQIKNLKNTDPRIRSVAATSLGVMGTKAAEAVPELERLAREDANPKVRDAAKEAIEKIRGTK